MKWKRLLDFVCLFFAAVSVVVGIRMMGRADVVPLTDPRVWASLMPWAPSCRR
jgi:hypothetical protein